MSCNCVEGQQLVIIQGVPLDFPLAVTSIGGIAMDLTGATFRGGLRKGWTAGLSVPFSVVLIEPTFGKGRVQLTEEQTSAIAWGSYVYDLSVVLSTGQAYPVLNGVADVRPGTKL